MQQVTKGIKISVKTNYEGSYFYEKNLRYAFAYTVTIQNQGLDRVQLKARHWEIKDSLNTLEIVNGEGVIGMKPILSPGEQHTYTSGCILVSPFGAMKGHYIMQNLDSPYYFEVQIPLFNLSAVFAQN